MLGRFDGWLEESAFASVTAPMSGVTAAAIAVCFKKFRLVDCREELSEELIVSFMAREAIIEIPREIKRIKETRFLDDMPWRVPQNLNKKTQILNHKKLVLLVVEIKMILEMNSTTR